MDRKLGGVLEFSRPPTTWDGPNFKVVPHPGSDQLVVFLTAALAKHHARDRFDWWVIGNELPVHRLFATNGSQNAWYQSGIPNLGESVEETLRTIERWAAHLGARDIVFVGTSMGAYGAALMAALAGCRALAFSPETRLRLAGSRSLKMMQGAVNGAYRDLRPLVEAGQAEITAFCSERDPVDLFCVQQMHGAKNFTGRVVSRAVHGVSGDLSRMGLLRPLVEAFVTGKPLPPLYVDSFILDEDKDFPRRFYNMHAAFTRGDFEGALRYGEFLLRRATMSDHVHYLYGRALHSLGRYREAISAYAASEALWRPSGETRYLIASCLYRLEEYERGLDLLTASLALFPEEPRLHHELGKIYLRFELFEEARLSVSMAMKMADNPSYQKTYEKIESTKNAGKISSNARIVRFRETFSQRQ